MFYPASIHKIMECPFLGLPIICSCILLHVILLSSVNASLHLESTLHVSRNESDRLALLAFKQGIQEDPIRILSSWNDSLHFCQWQGVSCSRRHHQRVAMLNLSGYGLVGPISPYIGNLSFLRAMILSANEFHGEIPQEIVHLFQLQLLDLSENSLQGEIPANMSYCSELKTIMLDYNQFIGELPIEFASLPKLNVLSLGGNNLTGSILPSLGNVSSLAIFYLAYNNFKGSIPHELGLLSSLKVFQVSGNQLSGTIPGPIYNLSSVEQFNLAANQLHGHISPDIALAFPQLYELHLGENQFTGPLPVSLFNASKLEQVDLGYSNFSGPMPVNLGSLRELHYFSVESNRIGSKEGDDLQFLISMTNCSRLQMLSVFDNHLTGALPEAISNFSTELAELYLGRNNIHGSIPRGIENLVGLIVLGLNGNLLRGTIPNGIGMLKELRVLLLQSNEISGEIPSSIGNITNLITLDLHDNDLQGSVPLSFTQWRFMDDLYLSRNNLSGTLIRVEAIRLSLSSNSFKGPLVIEVGNLRQISLLDVSKNKLSGEIPGILEKCESLEILFMYDNLFQGTIPQSFSALKGIKQIDLALNNLSGQIPKYFENFLYLEYLNLSFNNLEGEVPKGGIFNSISAFSISGNKNLCGGILELHLPPCPKQAPKERAKSFSRKSKIILVSVVLSSFLLLCILFTLFWIRKSRRKPSHPSFMEDQWLQVSYGDLLKATNGFSSANLIGVGGFGSVYKVFLDCIETIVVVKVLNLLQRGSVQSFLAECEALRNIRHRNLVKIITVCSSIDFRGNDFKALVFEYMPNGSLDDWLHQNVNEEQLPRNLNLIQRLNIAIDVASALDYLHQHSQTPIVHRDLKPSNVLLDDDMVAHVSDFGLAKIATEVASNFSENQVSTSEIKGSIGYVAPEYGMGAKASTHGDVYSYGILLLEMFTGRKPTDDMFKDDFNLHHFAKIACPERIREIIDSRLLAKQSKAIKGTKHHIYLRNKIHHCLVSMITIGLSCSAESPMERLEMRDVLAKLHGIRDLYLGVGFIRKDRASSSQ